MCDAKVKISIQCNESCKASLETYFCPTPLPPPKKKERKNWIGNFRHHLLQKKTMNISKNIKTSIQIFLLGHIASLLCTEHGGMPSFYA